MTDFRAGKRGGCDFGPSSHVLRFCDRVVLTTNRL
jgi:hypothetical protein